MTFVPDYGISTGVLENFIVEVTQQCNFRCGYCCFSGEYAGMRSHNNRSMPVDTARNTIDFICRHAPAEGPVYVSFYGGEALLEFGLVIRIIEALRLRLGTRVIFDVSTNGWLLSPDVVDRILTVPDVNVSVSLDGTARIHDRNRRHSSGAVTFGKIVANLQYFKRKNETEYRRRIRLLVTVGSMDDLREIDRSFATLGDLAGDKPILVSHLLPNFARNILFRDSLETKTAFIEEALEQKRSGASNLHTRVFDELQFKRQRKFECDGCASLKLHTCVNSLQSCFINIDGTVFPCEKVKEHCAIGDVCGGIDPDRIRKLAVKYALRRNMVCHDCDYVAYCKRCLIDLNYSLAEQKILCDDYKENVDLALKYGYE